jgi:hypothetical protein
MTHDPRDDPHLLYNRGAHVGPIGKAEYREVPAASLRAVAERVGITIEPDGSASIRAVSAAVVYRYALPVADEASPLELPVGAKFLHVACKDGEGSPSLWFECSVGATTERRHFLIVPTGRELELNRMKSFLGTALAYGGSLVWHVYEVSR